MPTSTLIDFEKPKTPRQGGAQQREMHALLPSVVMGVVMGAVGALVFACWEGGILGRMGQPLPTEGLLVATLVVYALVGAVFGLLPGLLRRRGADWAFATMMLFGAWLLSGKLGMAFLEAGSPGWMAVLLLLPAGMVVGAVVSASEIPDGVKLGAAAMAFVVLAIGLPVNTHLLGSITSQLALMVDVAVLLAGLVAGTLVAAVVGTVGRAGAALPLVLGALGGGFLVWPVLEPAGLTWPRATSDAHPPVVLVVVDTLRADHLGLYGYDRPTSPNLDRIARRGVVYTDASSSAPWTLPSMGSILTGQVPSRHGAGVNLGDGNERPPLRPSMPLLSTRLQEAEYVTAGITTNPFVTATFGFQQGFDVYDDHVMPAAMPAAVHPLWVMGIDPIRWPLYRPADTITDRALDFVSSQEHSAWFLLVHYMDVHGPHRPDPEDVEAVGVGQRGDLVDDYDAAIHKVDRHLGRLFEELPRNAWVFVTSDHGEQLVEKRVHVGQNVPAGTRHGHTLYQDQLHVPLVVLGPGVGGRRVSRTVSTLDITPTILQKLRLELPDRMSGHPLPEVVGGSTTPHMVYADSLRFGVEQQMVRHGKDKLVRWHTQGVLLFDLQANPEESQAVSAQSSQETQALIRRLEGELPPVGVASVRDRVPIGAEVKLLLERLGYTNAPEPEPAEEEETTP
ncbi:MAG: sulfatase-like hydrolase/transferase [Deltaproteobacteria bacterium]|nr:sulfatase-like hydrolase/transferase [Deltaproteobacteria bacterium]